ncbi:stage II sporulation protein D [Aquibacillus rhizosphaerae]|uniref:Stage II sporulation protein D n=1 Tax=Aquibacillus rhizosphaerae TaxID=3051431 RepID=A0ABT7KZG4_9BACI|nr:stage II sporulation protein D [Aquibacillus sp. LR5S19]MDL4838868.1 stage II sporulation protein D [Aquibacillus sp. LR5S19]
MNRWKKSPTKNKWKKHVTSKKFQQQVESSRWKAPSIIIVVSLFSLILLVPTLIVFPFIQEDGTETESVDTAPKKEEVAMEVSDSPFSVKVFRASEETTEDVPLEEYVTRVVASEMPADFELEALKAQALAARTYIVNYLMHAKKGSLPQGSDVTDTVQHQVYKDEDELRQQWGTDYNWKIDKISRAVYETMGEILTYNDQPITPSFFSTSNGYTEDSENYWTNELPYLRSVASPWDEDSPKFLDQKIFTVSEVEKALEIQISPDSESFEISRTESNRVAEINLAGQKFSGREVREALGLNSSDFEITKKNNHLVFTTKGYGHGVGMSQYGANGMAQEGKNYKEIAMYFYQDTEINQVKTTAPTLASGE